MPEVNKNFDPPKTGPKSQNKYLSWYNLLMDLPAGQALTLRKGADYVCTTQALRVMFYKWMAENDVINIRISFDPDQEDTLHLWRKGDEQE